MTRHPGGDELRSLILLRLLPGVGDRTASGLVRAQGSARRVLELPSRVFADAAGRKAEAARSDPDLADRVEWILERCSELGIRIVGLDEPGYPTVLEALCDPPPVLFLRGRMPLPDGPSVAIVGSRRATATGRRVAERTARELSRMGVPVISGMALGIDGAAHRGALEGRGGTVAVLGSGPDRPYPSANRGLFRRILEDGLVVSEFPPGEGARPYHFPRRNRILAALARAVVVVEAAERSGALITVDHALDLGREVFAVPGSLETPQARGTNALLRDGAHLLTDPSELMETMGWTAAVAPVSVPDRTAGAGRSGAGEETDTGRVVRALGDAPRPLDAVVARAGLTPPRALAALTRLELAGDVDRSGEGWRLRSSR